MPVIYNIYMRRSAIRSAGVLLSVRMAIIGGNGNGRKERYCGRGNDRLCKKMKVNTTLFIHPKE